MARNTDSPISRLLKWIREICAVFFWVYALAKVFVFDIDVFVINKFLPEYAQLLEFKFFIIIGLIAILWLVMKNKHVLIWCLYIGFYPLVITFWKIPFFVYKQESWIFAFALINAIISFFKSIKYNFITAAVFLISLVGTLTLSNTKLLWLSIFSVLTVLAITYIYRFILVFKPSRIFQMHIKIFTGIRKYAAPSFSLDEDMRNLPVAQFDEKQLEKWTVKLQTCLVFNRVCLFVSKKLRDYQNSGLNIVSNVMTVLLLVIFTVVAFAGINYGLYKVDSQLFSLSAAPAFFTFFYYSFNNLLFNSIKEIAPIAPASQIISMTESYIALFLVLIFVSLLLSVKSQRHANELDKAIEEIEREGKSMETLIRDEYRLTSIKDAIEEQERLKGGLAKILYQIYPHL